MKRLLLAAAGLAAVAGLVVLLRPAIGQTPQPGSTAEPFAVPVGQPGSGTTTLQTLVPQSAPAGVPYLPTTSGYNQLPGATGKIGDKGQVYIGNSEHPCYLQEYLNQSLDNVKINDDLVVQPGVGPWMVCISCYSGADAPQLARELCLYLRSKFNLPAYVFTKGLEERKKELERITEYVQRQRAALAKADLPSDTPVRIRVPLTRFEIECAVLVGGYKDVEAAHKAREQFARNQKYGNDKWDASALKLLHGQPEVDPKTGLSDPKKVVAINPFKTCMVVHNPTVDVSKPTAEETANDLKLLRALNENEPYSLFRCPKKYTLVVKQFSLPVELKHDPKSNSMLSGINLNWFQAKQEDYAAINAHNLADFLRKGKLEAYVLHTKHTSYVFVGSYDSERDPKLKLDQERLPSYNDQFKLDPAIRLLAHPVVAEVPR